MTPAARVQTLIDLLAEAYRQAAPADAVANSFFRQRRYMGSKDRQAVASEFYALWRHHARLGWWLARAGGADTARTRVLAWRVLNGQAPAELATLCLGGRHTPDRLQDVEQRLLQGLVGQPWVHPAMPQAVQYEVPATALPEIRRSLPDDWQDELRAQLVPAPVDIRVNTLQAERAAVQAELAEAGIAMQPTRWSPVGLRAVERPSLMGSAALRAGRIEIQDEGSQLVALLCAAQPGMAVLDLCAGAGGKTLALAAAMQNKGRITACDVLARRLERAQLRFRRAGVHNIAVHALAGLADKWLQRRAGHFDRVLVDAPCSGTGTWRRNPDARWQRALPGLDEVMAKQRAIMLAAAPLVKPGGRLIYATCSLLRCENHDTVADFLQARPEFRLLPVPLLWSALLPGAPPADEPMLQLTAHRHQTDGFFCAVLERHS